MLADYTSFTGNFATVAIQCLEKTPNNNSKFTYTCDKHTFNYVVDGGFSTFLPWLPCWELHVVDVCLQLHGWQAPCTL